jgi:hypothetical protein
MCGEEAAQMPQIYVGVFIMPMRHYFCSPMNDKCDLQGAAMKFPE